MIFMVITVFAVSLESVLAWLVLVAATLLVFAIVAYVAVYTWNRSGGGGKADGEEEEEELDSDEGEEEETPE